MFRVHGDKIYFLEWEVAKLEPWLRDSVRQDLVRELELHTKATEVERMRERIGDLEAKISHTSVDELLGAKW